MGDGVEQFAQIGGADSDVISDLIVGKAAVHIVIRDILLGLVDIFVLVLPAVIKYHPQKPPFLPLHIALNLLWPGHSRQSAVPLT